MKYSMPSIFVFLLLGSTFTTGNSQNSGTGYLLSVQGDTVPGFIQVVNSPTYADVIQHFVVRGPDGSEKAWESKAIAEYAVDQGPGTAGRIPNHFYAKVWPHNGLRVFLQPDLAGRAQLYKVPDPERPWEPTSPNKIVFEKNDASIEKASYVSFPGTALMVRMQPDNYDLVLRQLLKDCPKLTAQIGGKKFKFRDLEHIITFYNESCE